jgi:hypothetical protein
VRKLAAVSLRRALLFFESIIISILEMGERTIMLINPREKIAIDRRRLHSFRLFAQGILMKEGLAIDAAARVARFFQ